MRRLTLTIVLTGSLLACRSEPRPLSLDQAVAAVDVEMFLRHMAELSSDRMAGRRPGTAGFDSAAAYVIREARALGLEPGGSEGTYRQPIRFRQSRLEPSTASFSVAGHPLAPGTDFSISPRLAHAGTDLRAPMVFAGFGISAPDLGYDDFEGIDVRGKLVVVMQGAPDGFGPLERTVLSSHPVRAAELMARGAAGVVVVQADETTTPQPTRPRTRFLVPAASAPQTGADTDEELDVVLTVPGRLAESWMREAGRGLGEVRERIRAGEPTSFDLRTEGWVRAEYLHETFTSANVAAVLPGADPELRDEVLVMTAHLDHLGIGPAAEGDSIYNGTLDNASGSSALLTLASILARMDAPRRSLLFLWVTAEESGLLGAEYFARYPTVGPGRVVANQNVDGVMGMITAASDVLAFGYEHSNLSDAVDFAVARTGTPVSPDPTPEENLFIRSDQYAFVRQGIPAIWVQSGRTGLGPARDPLSRLDTWVADRYHRPSDDMDQPMDLDGVRAELGVNLLVTYYILDEMGPIRWSAESFLYRRWSGE